MKNTALVIYTNSDYHDVMSIFHYSFEKYFSFNIKKYVVTNKIFNPDSYINIIYDDKDLYSERLYKSLQQIQEKNILFIHEDMFLYDFVDEEKLSYLEKFLDDGQLDYIKLIRTGDDRLIKFKNENNIFTFPLNSLTAFAIQPTLWKKEKFVNFLSKKNKGIWDLELYCQHECLYNYKGSYVYDKESIKRGDSHWDSKIFPYIATAIVKGKWNFKEYEKELKLICGNNYDFSIRGLFF